MFISSSQTASTCTLFTDWFAVFDLYEMEKFLGYYSQDGLEWNYCDNLPGETYFARKVKDDGTVIPFEPGVFNPLIDSADLIFKRGEVIGVQRYTPTNDTCAEDPSRNYTFIENILCDENIQGQGNASIVNVDQSDPCAPTVSVAHASGCPIITASHMFIYLADSEWKVVILQLFIGTFLAL